jgi:hypothetical protein
MLATGALQGLLQSDNHPHAGNNNDNNRNSNSNSSTLHRKLNACLKVKGGPALITSPNAGNWKRYIEN